MTERLKSSIIVFATTIVASVLVILPLHVPHIQIVTEVILLADVAASFILFVVQLFLYKKKPVLPALLISSSLANFASLVFCSASICEYTFNKGALYSLTSVFSIYDGNYVLLGCSCSIIVLSFLVFGISTIPFSKVELASRIAFENLHSQLAEKPTETKLEISAHAHYLFCVEKSVSLMKKLNYVEYIVGIIEVLFFCFISELQNRGVMIAAVIAVYLFVSLLNACTSGALLKNRKKQVK